MHSLGRRTAELHRALAEPGGDPAFDPEAIGHGDLVAWNKQVHAQVVQTRALLAQRRAALGTETQIEADGLLARGKELLRRIEHSVPVRVAASKTRYHGDYHLG